MIKPSRVQKGDAAVLLLASYLTEAGLVVLQPLCEALPFDLALFHGGRFFRLQVKRAQAKSVPGRYEIVFRKTTVNSAGPKTYRYTEEHTDQICGVVIETGDVYCFPIREIAHVQASLWVNPTGGADHHTRKVDVERFRNVIMLAKEKVRLGRY